MWVSQVVVVFLAVVSFGALGVGLRLAAGWLMPRGGGGGGAFLGDGGDGDGECALYGGGGTGGILDSL